MKKKLGLSLFGIVSGLLALCLVTGAFAASAGSKAEKVDVVVVGGGLAGLTAAVSAAEKGAKVVLLEKSAALGGNSLLATGIIYVGGTRLQKEAGIQDSPDAFYKDAMAASKDRRDPVQTRLIADMGGPMVDWLIGLGIEFDKKVTPVMGSSIPRAHSTVGNAPAQINGLAAAAKKKGVRILLETRATKLIEGKGGAIAGIEATRRNRTLRFDAPAVILATGGFYGNPSLVKKFTPSQEGGIYVGHPADTGDGLVMAMDKGADTVDINVPRLNPTVEIGQKQLITSLVLSKGGIIVNKNAQRFADEVASYEKTAEAIVMVMKTGDPFVYEIYDENVTEQVFKIADYRKQGIVVEAQTLDELAQKAGLDAAALKQTVAEYNEGVEKKSDKFGRVIFGKKLEKPPFGYLKIAPGLSIAPGGLKIDKDIRVVKKDGSVIPGLYAAGEVTGGYRAYGYIGGDSLAHNAVTGMVAGKNAAAYAKKK
jgi:fumarate reductase flavoprotein subunit